MPSTIARSRRLLAGVAPITLALTVAAAPTFAQDAEDPDALGTQLVGEFIDILKLDEGDKTTGLEAFLADEFQIVRSNGVVRDKAEYVESPASVNEVAISDMQATVNGDVLVASYVLSVDEELDGVETVTVAPRLSVFHLADDGRWQIAAHANFGALEAPMGDDS